MNNLNCTKVNTNSNKTPIILLHGWGGNIESLNPLLSELSNLTDHPIFNFELPGFGKSEMPKSVMGTHDYSESVFAELKNQNIKQAILVGHSFGGKTLIDAATTNLANKYGISIKALILINASGLKPKNSLKKTGAGLIKKLTPHQFQNNNLFKNIFYKHILRERDYLNAGKLKPSLSKIVEEHYDDQIANIDLHTLIIWGEKDNYVPLWMGRKLHDSINNSEFIIVPDATHGLPLFQPKVVAQIIYNWLNNSKIL